MKREAKAYLHDIQESAGHIQEFTKGMAIEDYCKSELIKAAVEQNSPLSVKPLSG